MQMFVHLLLTSHSKIRANETEEADAAHQYDVIETHQIGRENEQAAVYLQPFS